MNQKITVYSQGTLWFLSCGLMMIVSLHKLFSVPFWEIEGVLTSVHATSGTFLVRLSSKTQHKQTSAPEINRVCRQPSFSEQLQGLKVNFPSELLPSREWMHRVIRSVAVFWYTLSAGWRTHTVRHTAVKPTEAKHAAARVVMVSVWQYMCVRLDKVC